MLTLQEVFNKVWERAYTPIRSENEALLQPSTPGKNICSYRNPKDGVNHCFIGVCIPNEVYNEEFEGMGALDLFKSYPNEMKLIFGNMVTEYRAKNALSELQSIHDLIEPEFWHERLREFAIKYNLAIPE
mgnify:FL=1